MALHEELAELRAAVGPHVFDDPVAFRAAFDDFIPEGSATTGEVSLLVGAIATGALQRLKVQLALGADPGTSIAVQGDLLARDRGTTETAGAQWALSALAHALGAVPADLVLTRPTPGPDSVSTAGRPSSPAPGVVDPGPTHPAGAPATVPPPPPATPTHAIGPDPAPPTKGDVERTGPASRRANPLLIGVIAVLAVVAVTAIVLLLLRDDDSPSDAADSASETSDSASAGDEEILAQTDLEGPATVRLQMVRNGTDVEIVLLNDQDGEYVEVDRQPGGCPYLDASYDAGIEDQGDYQFFFGWQTRDNEGFGGYGAVEGDGAVLVVFEVDSCPTER